MFELTSLRKFSSYPAKILHFARSAGARSAIRNSNVPTCDPLIELMGLSIVPTEGIILVEFLFERGNGAGKNGFECGIGRDVTTNGVVSGTGPPRKRRAPDRLAVLILHF